MLLIVVCEMASRFQGRRARAVMSQIGEHRHR
jgi:hypothetical protein